MTNQELIIVKRLEREMSRTANNAQKIAADSGGIGSPLYKEAMQFFVGLGLALAICFEELTGKESKDLKPQELLLWARNLPEPQRRDRLVRLN